MYAPQLFQGTSGEVTVEQVGCKYAMPLDSGSGGSGTEVIQDVRIGYTITEDPVNGDAVRLTNDPDHGNFSVQLSCKATDPMGTVREATAWVEFEGNPVEIGGGYQDYFWGVCFKNWYLSLRPGRVPPPMPPSHDPRALREMIYGLVVSGHPMAGEMLVGTELLYGATYRAALGAPARRVAAPAKLTGRAERTTLLETEAER